MASVAQRRKKLHVGGIWHDCFDNKVEIKRIADGKVWFEILELVDHQPKKLPDGAVRIMPMEDRIESMKIGNFIATPTGFDCMSEFGRPRNKLW
jgi:hypothetical protein